MSKTNPVVQKLLDASESFDDLEAASPGCDATDDGSGTRKQWMELAEEAGADALAWKRKASALAQTMRPVIMQLERDLAQARRAAEALAEESAGVLHDMRTYAKILPWREDRIRKALAQWEEAKKLSKGITKREALDAVAGLGAIQAVEHLAGALANANDLNAVGIRAAMLSIQAELETWADMKAREGK